MNKLGGNSTNMVKQNIKRTITIEIYQITQLKEEYETETMRVTIRDSSKNKCNSNFETKCY